MMKSWQKKLAERVDSLHHRERRLVEPADDYFLEVGGQRCVDFSSNDYLGLKKHPRVVETLVNASQKYGCGSGASAFVSGYCSAHQEAEQAFAQWLGVDRALLFTSGYAANIGVFAALSQRSDILFSDKLCHASILDGILLSRAKHVRYPHNDSERARHMAEKYPPHLIVTESIFSMEGDIAPIPALVALARDYDAGLIIDDAHGIGVLGQTGKGVKEYFALASDQYTCLMMPLGKAFHAMGAMVVGSHETMEAILQFSRSYCYSTALPPILCLAIQTTIDILQQETWRQQQLQKNIAFFKQYAASQGLMMVANDSTPIQSVIVQGNQRVLSLQAWLLAKGFYTAAIRSPTVPVNTERLRLSIHTHHTQDELTQLIDSIVEGMRAC